MKGDNKKQTSNEMTETNKNTTQSNKKKISLRSRYQRKSDKDELKKKKSGSSGSSSSTEEEDDFDHREFNKFLTKLFPSKYITQRAQEILDEHKSDKETSNEEDDEEYLPKHKKTVKKYKRKIIESSQESERDDNNESSSDDEKNSDGEMYGKIYSKKKAFNIMVSLDDPTRYYDDEEDEDEDEDDDYEDEDDDDDEEEESKIEYSDVDVKVLDTFSDMAQKMNKKYKNSELMKEIIEYGKEVRKDINKQKKEKDKKFIKKNAKAFNKLIKNKRSQSDTTLFKKLDIDKQEKMLEKLRELKEYNDDEEPLRIALMNTDIPVKYKSAAMRKINTLEYMEEGTNEYFKLKQWVDTFMRIPFNKYSNLPITIDDGIEKCHEFMESANKTLNDAVFGLNDAKMQIIQMVGQWITNPNAIGSAIAIKGPMGTGKTTLVKDGISKILGREFAFIALGGATDSSVLEGHSYTYEGSTWGKIVDILVQCKSMNPVIYFDELDKISNTPKGEEIASILTHLTDTTQNDTFHDKYFSEIELDLSKCLFIFSYNEEEKVNPILKDRMYRISTKGYDVKEKTEIVQKYLLPKIREQLKFEKDEIVIPDEVLRYIIEKYTMEEDGVRNLKRCLETIYRKLNLFKLMKPGINIFENDIKLDVKFPFTLTNENVDKIIKTDDSKKAPMSMYM